VALYAGCRELLIHLAAHLTPLNDLFPCLLCTLFPGHDNPLDHSPYPFRGLERPVEFALLSQDGLLGACMRDSLICFVPSGDGRCRRAVKARMDGHLGKL